MKFFNFVSTASVALLLSGTSARKFSQPIFSKKVSSSVFVPETHDGGGVKQKILQAPPGGLRKSGAGPLGLPIQSPQTLLYTTPISLGTPPQSIPAIIDVTWSDLFAPSISCGGSHHCASKTKYNSSSSSTYHEVGTVKRTTYGPVFAYGKESIETLTLGNLSVPESHFQELSYYEEVYPDYGLEGWDSVLGLTYERPMWLDDPRSPNTLASPFKTMVDSHALERNVFSIKLPRNDTEVGDIVFGGLNEDLSDEDSVVWNALYPENTTQWQIEVVGVSMSTCGERERTGRETPVNYELKSYSGLFMTASPLLGFPKAIASSLLSRLPSEPSVCGREMVVPCSSVPDLPDLVISLGGGHEIVLKASDYVAEITLPWCSEPVVECMPLIEAIPEQVPGFELPKDLVILGSTFLKSVYTVFDWDEKRVGLGKLKA